MFGSSVWCSKTIHVWVPSKLPLSQGSHVLFRCMMFWNRSRLSIIKTPFVWELSCFVPLYDILKRLRTIKALFYSRDLMFWFAVWYSEKKFTFEYHQIQFTPGPSRFVPLYDVLKQFTFEYHQNLIYSRASMFYSTAWYSEIVHVWVPSKRHLFQDILFSNSSQTVHFWVPSKIPFILGPSCFVPLYNVLNQVMFRYYQNAIYSRILMFCSTV